MKYAICNETFGDWPFDKVCQFAKSCGYTGVEIAPFTINTNAADITPAQREELKAQAAEAGVEIVGLHWLLAKTQGLHLTTSDVQVRHATAEYLRTLAHLCRDLGGSVMVFGSPQQRNVQPGVTHDQATGFAVEVLQSIVPTLEETEVTIALEPLGPAEGNFLNTAAEAVAMIHAIGSPWYRLHLDCKAMSTEAAPIPEVIRANADLLEHFHANDPNLLGPGMGELEFEPILAALKDIGYDKWVSVEVFDYSPGPERIAQESISYLEKCAS